MEVSFSEGMEQVLDYGLEEAVRTGNLSIHTEHLLLGILRLGRGSAFSVLRQCGVDTIRLKAILESSVQTGEYVNQGDFTEIDMTDEAEILMGYAMDEKNKSGDEEIHTIHFLLAIMFAGFGNTGELLEGSFGLTYNKIRQTYDAKSGSGDTELLEFIGRFRNGFIS